MTTDNNFTETNYFGLLGDFQNAHQNNTLVMDHGRVLREPKGPLIVRAEPDNKTIYVSANEMRKYLLAKQVSYQGFITAMRLDGTLIYEGTQRLSRGWPGMSDAAATKVLGFKFITGIDEIDDGSAEGA